MKNHIITVTVRLQSEDRITRDEVLADLRKQLGELQEQPPYRLADGASWWTKSPVQVTFEPATVPGI